MNSNDTSRRSLLKLVAAGVGGIGLAGAAAGDAEAANGDFLKLGVDVGQVANHGTGFAVQGVSTSANAYGLAVTDEGFSNIAFNTYGACVVGHAQNSNFNTGVTGIGFNGAYGVRGIADNGGAGLYGEGTTSLPASRTVSVASALGAGTVVVPGQATAVVVNISLNSTTGTGNLLAHRAGIATPTANTLSWWGPGQAPCNQVLISVNAARKITLAASGSGTTHVALDVSGYYR